MTGNGRFGVLGGLAFMNQNKAGSTEQKTASGTAQSSRNQAGPEGFAPLRVKKSYKVKSGQSQDASAPPAPAAAGATANASAAGNPKLSSRINSMPFMMKGKLKRKRDEEESHAAANEDEPMPAAAAAVAVAAGGAGGLEAAGAAPSTTNPITSSSSGAKPRLVIMQGKDPDPMASFTRLSYGGCNPVVESLQSPAKGEAAAANKAAAAGAGQQQEEGVDVGRGDMAAALGSISSGGRRHHQHHHHHHQQRHQQQDDDRWISGKNAFRSGVKKHKR